MTEQEVKDILGRAREAELAYRAARQKGKKLLEKLSREKNIITEISGSTAEENDRKLFEETCRALAENEDEQRKAAEIRNAAFEKASPLIETISAENTRSIMYKYYFQCMNRKETAAETHYSERHIRRLQSSAIKKISEKY